MSLCDTDPSSMNRGVSKFLSSYSKELKRTIPEVDYSINSIQTKEQQLKGDMQKKKKKNPQ